MFTGLLFNLRKHPYLPIFGHCYLPFTSFPILLHFLRVTGVIFNKSITSCRVSMFFVATVMGIDSWMTLLITSSRSLTVIFCIWRILCSILPPLQSATIVCRGKYMNSLMNGEKSCGVFTNSFLTEMSDFIYLIFYALWR